MLTSFREVIDYLLQTSTIDIVITGMDAEIIKFTQSSKMTLAEYTGALWNKVPCDLVYKEYA